MAQIDGHRIHVNLPLLRHDDFSNTYISTGFDYDLTTANFTPVLRFDDFPQTYFSKIRFRPFKSNFATKYEILSTVQKSQNSPDDIAPNLLRQNTSKNSSTIMNQDNNEPPKF